MGIPWLSHYYGSSQVPAAELGCKEAADLTKLPLGTGSTYGGQRAKGPKLDGFFWGGEDLWIS